MGALGVMVPYVNTAAEAKAAVAAMRYPPHGIRGVAKFNRGAGFGGDFEEYYLHGHERLLTVIQIESPEAVANIDAIAAVDGADVLFVGPTDLSYNMGIRDQLESSQFTEVLKKVSDAAKAHGKAAGILVHIPALVPRVRELGYTFVALGSDGGGVRSSLLGFVQTLRGK
jgi:2-keto-3-deoxy-L-rhamnonate aldolase RhmA